MASEKVPWPVQASNPMKISEPMPAATRPGHQHQSQHRTAQPGRFHDQKGAGQRGPEQGADGSETTRGADHTDGLWGGIPFRQADGAGRQPATQGDEGRLWADDGTKGQAGQGRQGHAGQLNRRWCSCHLETIGRRVPAPPRQILNGQPHQHPAKPDHGQWPPDRLAVKAQPLQEVVGIKQPFLQLRHQNQIPVRHRRDRSSEHRSENQEHQVLRVRSKATTSLPDMVMSSRSQVNMAELLRPAPRRRSHRIVHPDTTHKG